MIESDGRASGGSVTGAGQAVVSAGGIVSSIVVSDGGRQFVAGVTSNTAVGGGGSEIISNGGLSVSASIDGPGTQSVLAGGEAKGTTVLSGGTQFVAAGGTAAFTSVYAGGTLRSEAGGNTVGVLVDGGRQIVGAGDPASGTTVTNGGVLVVSAGGEVDDAIIASGGTSVDLPGSMVAQTVSAGGTAISAGVIDVGPGGVIEAGLVVANATIGAGDEQYVLAGGNAIDTAVGAGGYEGVFASGSATGVALGGGILEIASGGTLAGLDFTSAGGMLLADAATPGALISGFAVGNEIDLASFSYAPGSSTVSASGDAVTITNAGSSTTLNLLGAGGQSFQVAPDAAAGTLLTVDATPCYCPGTMILTDRGEAPIEALAIGDRVVTARGALEPIRWIGRRSYAGRFLAGKRHLLPVTIRAGALGGGLPRRDLRVSPLHAMFLDGVLVPAGQLVNGSTIRQEPDCQLVHYIHLELIRHDIVLAEGAPSETFLDDDSRGMFHNAREYDALYPGAPAPGGFCAPRVESGFALEAIRRRLAAVAGAMTQAA